MPRFAKMLVDGMRQRGHKVDVLTTQPLFYRLPFPKSLKKWMGYLDQYVVFPFIFRNYVKSCTKDTLFVFTDHALGPWVPLIANRPHVIHCHDFLAQLSAKGEIKENKTNWTGRKYQAYIRQGYSQGKNFISVSEKTKNDLQGFLPSPPSISEVIYNGLNQTFAHQTTMQVRTELSKKVGLALSKGYILHVGGNQWYKNRLGVIEVYDAWRSTGKEILPLLMIGKKPNSTIAEGYNQSPFKADIHFISGLDDEFVRMAYSGATVLLFPSLAEGFGWPIAEAMASGCPVITTNEAPMTEVAGEAGYLIPRRPNKKSEYYVWATEAAKILQDVITLTPAKRKTVVDAGLINAQRFDPEKTLDKIEKIYKQVLLEAKD
jgi:glycosyltransferase involved in cell wall biosynthesis